MIFLILHEGVVSSFHTKILDLLGRKLLLFVDKQRTIFMLCSEAFCYKNLERELVQKLCRVYSAGL